MKKCLLFILVLVVSFCSINNNTYSYSSDKHDEYLEEVIFGGNRLNDKADEIIDLLNTASYLAIDFFNTSNKGENCIKKLNDNKVKYLPEINDIYYSSNPYHRQYTHRGWNHIYEDDKGNWKSRKIILQSTVNKLFNFKLSKDQLDRENQCNAFSALIYYVHIVGDHIHDYECSQYYEPRIQIPLSNVYEPYKAGQGSQDNNDSNVIYDLTKWLKILFKNQKGKHQYINVIQKLNSIYYELEKIRKQEGGLNTKDRRNAYEKYSEDIMEVLKLYVPLLLKDEEFYRSVVIR